MRVINKKKALYNSLMEGISRSLRNIINEDNNGMHMDLHDDFTITQDENTAKSFVAYLKAINKKQRLSQEDECKLADIIQHSPNKRQVEAAKNKLVSANLPFVVSVVNKYKNLNIPKEDLIQYGNIGLMKAADRFDYTKGYKFSTYATWWIRQGIRRFIADTSRTIRIPAHQYEYVRKMNAVKSRLFNELQRMPTDIELAQALEITVDKLHYLQNIEIDAVSLSAPINDNDDDTMIALQ